MARVEWHSQASSPAAGRAISAADAGRHRVAAHIEWQKQGGWAVLWGGYTRRFWAFARWPVPPGGVVVCAAEPAQLYREMREAERRHRFLQWRCGRDGRTVPAS